LDVGCGTGNLAVRLAPAAVEVVEETLGAAATRVQTGADGSFRVSGLRAVPQRVTVRSPGYVSEQRWAEPRSDVTFALLRGAAVSGQVEDADGRPVAHAELEVSGRSITGAAVHMVGPIQEAPVPELVPAGSGVVQDRRLELGAAASLGPRLPVVASKDPALPGLVGFHCDERGRFLLEDLPPGQLVIAARKPVKCVPPSRCGMLFVKHSTFSL